MAHALWLLRVKSVPTEEQKLVLRQRSKDLGLSDVLKENGCFRHVVYNDEENGETFTLNFFYSMEGLHKSRDSHAYQNVYGDYVPKVVEELFLEELVADPNKFDLPVEE